MTVQCDFFISYTHHDETWATWVAWILEAEGFTTKIQSWDFQAGSNFVAEMHEAIETSDRLILILSENFLRSGFTKAEWAVFFSKDPDGRKRSIVPVRIENCRPVGLLKTIVYLDIHNLAEDDAKAKLINFFTASKHALRGRLKPPQKPTFPASSPAFPIPEKQSKAIHVTFSNQHLLSPIDPVELANALTTNKRLQVALDVESLDDAKNIARLALDAGADILEVGDPLVQRYGMTAVREIREKFPGVPLVAELASSDWADEQVELAAKSGADCVLLMGLRKEIRVERAVNSARKHKVGLILELPPEKSVSEWASFAEQNGVDGMAVIRNIDSSTPATDSIRRMRLLRKYAKTPIAISGGFTVEGIAKISDEPWDIVIVGRAITSSRNIAATVASIVKVIRK